MTSLRACLGTAVAVLLLPAVLPVAASPAPGQTQVSTTLFVNASDLQRTGAQTKDEGLGVDLQRFYIDVHHRFDSQWSARVTTDINWLRQQDPTDLWVKYAYIQRTFGRRLALRFGSAPTPWAEFANVWGGYRYIDKELLTRMKVGSAADWGVHAVGGLGRISYAVSAVTGAGFKHPRTGHDVDVEARLAWQPSPHSVLGIGGYRGTRAQDINGAPHRHTAERWNALAAYVNGRVRFGAQYFHASNWTRVTALLPDAASGWSSWASYRVLPKVAIFGRYDRSRPSLLLAPSRSDRYSQLGVEWIPNRYMRLALAGKHEVINTGTVRRKSNEWGVWGMFKF